VAGCNVGFRNGGSIRDASADGAFNDAHQAPDAGPGCGNGLAEEDEECDGADLKNQTCADVTQHPNGQLGCTANCQLDTADCHTCGNGTVEGGETCDGSEFAGQTCAAAGHSGGELTCGANCAIDTSSCFDCTDGPCDWAKGENHLNCPADCPPIMVSTGLYHTCALKADGTVWCWGGNQSGEIGDGTQTQRLAPVEIVFADPAVAVAAGAEHTCAILTDGSTWCWGRNQYGELGDGSMTGRTSPVQVQGLAGAVSICTGGANHTCASTDAGVVWCWGAHQYGQVGIGPVAPDTCATLPCARTPQPVGGLSSVNEVGTDSHTSCAVAPTLSGRNVWCWGRNSEGQVGDGTQFDRNTPVQVLTLQGALTVTSGDQHTCAVLSDTTAWCWGRNQYGELGDGTNTNSITPVQVLSITGFIGISAGEDHTCAVRNNGTVWCWGSNAVGQLGVPLATNESNAPLRVNPLANALSVDTSEFHSCAVENDGGVWCWGGNSRGQLGDGTTSNNPLPVSPIDLF
jgi:alpha-tubulin suppressor-like RCC1 family protein